MSRAAAGASVAAYLGAQNRRFCRLLALAAVTLFLALWDLQVGSSSIPASEVLRSLIRFSENSATEFIVREIRVPMTLTCAFVGAALSLAGFLIQTITNNPLASPYTLGVTAAASFGASIAVTVGFSLFGFLWIGTSLAALLFALMVAGLMTFLGRVRRMSATTLILTGILVNFLFQALQQYLQYRASPEVAQILSGWTFGNLQRASYTSLSVAGLAWLFGLLLSARFVWALTALSVGDVRAESLGVPVARMRLMLFSLASVLVAASVCFIGTVAFVGLVAPHCAKRLFGEDARVLLPAVSLLGAALLLAASVFSKFLSDGATLPVGIVTSLIGVPFLFSLLMREKAQ